MSRQHNSWLTRWQSSRRRARQRKQLLLESLESRQLMVANLTATLVGDVLQVEGTEAADVIDIRQDAGQLRVVGATVQVAGAAADSVNARSVRRIEVLGLGGNDRITLANGSQPIKANSRLDGGAGDDVIFGGSRADLILGGTGNDRLVGGAGNDVLDGGADHDIYSFDADSLLGIDVIRDSSGIDSLDFSATTTQGMTLDLSQFGTNQVLNLNHTVRIAPGTMIENVSGSQLADRLTGNDSANRLRGNGGDDTLEGCGGDDLLKGGTGANTYRFDADSPLGTDRVDDGGGTGGLLEFTATSTSVTLDLADATVQPVNSNLTLVLVGGAANMRAVGLPSYDADVGTETDYLTATPWSKKTLTYGYSNFTQDVSVARIRAAVEAAFKLWSDVTPLTFLEAAAGATPDIAIGFYAGDHGDGSPFDGPSTVLAHAFYPGSSGLAGDVHFDDAELWGDAAAGSSVDLLTVAAHEIGHALGLAHSTIRSSLMFPTYSGPHRALDADDVAGIQSLYGVRARNVRYEGVSPITAMIPYQGGFLTAFTNVEGKPYLNRVHWSTDGMNLGSGRIVYEGVSPVTAMVPYKGGVLTAFTNVGGNPSLNRVHWSPDGESLGGGPIRYEGISPVTAMTVYRDGVLTAFTNIAGNTGLNRIHWSADGDNLGGGPIRYEGISPVTAMAAFQGGVLTAFTNVAGNPSLNRVHWSVDGENLGGGPIRYEGISPVTAIVAYRSGVLTAFTNVAGIQALNRVHWSDNGEALGAGPVRYEGVSPVEALGLYGDGVLTAFSNCEGNPNLHRIHWSNDGTALGG